MRTNEHEGGGGTRGEGSAGAEQGGAMPAGWIDAGRLLGEGIGLLFTDREGGISPPPYHSCNLSYRSGDAAENVCANRKTVAAVMGLAPERFVYLEQVHGVAVKRAAADNVDETGHGGRGELAETDGVYTAETGMVLAVLTADCVPLALSVPSAGIVAMLHAGWRGTIGDIAGEALRTLTSETGFDSSGVRVVMGPAIGSCCYEVDEGRARLFVERYGRESGVVSDDGGYHLDLLAANRINLLEAGALESNIKRSGGCTCCEKRYYSFRRDGETGRQGAFIFLQQKEAADTG